MKEKVAKKLKLYKIQDANCKKSKLTIRFCELKQKAFFRKYFENKMWCAKCGSTQNLTFDHIKPRGRYPELTRQLDNLQILCLFKCHAFKTSIEKTDWFDNDKFLRGDYDK